MNPILAKIIETGTCPSLDGKSEVKVSATSVSPREGELIQKALRATEACLSLETGLAYGTSALYICEALRQTENAQHIVIDPYQHHDEAAWKGLGINNLRLAGYEKKIRFIEKPSHLALPQLIEENLAIDFGFIDGYHTFDHTLLDFFYIDQLLKVGGIVVFDDTNWQSIRKVCSFVLKNRDYEVFDWINVETGMTSMRRIMNQLMKKIAKIPKLASYFEPESCFLNEKLDQLTYGGSLALRKKSHDQRISNYFVRF